MLAQCIPGVSVFLSLFSCSFLLSAGLSVPSLPSYSLTHPVFFFPTHKHNFTQQKIVKQRVFCFFSSSLMLVFVLIFLLLLLPALCIYQQPPPSSPFSLFI